MNRREFAAMSVAGLSVITGGCMAEQATANTVKPPTVTAEDYTVDDPYTVFEVGWDVAAATSVDLDSGDGISTSAPPGKMYLFLLTSVTNVGERELRFFPDSFQLHADGTEYRPAWFGHIASPFPTQGSLNPGDSLGGWIPYEVARDFEDGTITVSGGQYVNDPKVIFKRNNSLTPPF